jgi:hypothetical protein
MFIDSLLLFSDAQALTATAASTNVIDLSQDRDIGVGEPMSVVLVLDVGADATTGDETYSVAIQTDDADTFGSASTLGTFTITRGTAAGTLFEFPLPDTNERYLRLNYTLGGTTPTVTVTAFLQPKSMVQQSRYYARGYTVS